MKYRKTLPWFAAVACLSTACASTTAATPATTSSQPAATSGVSSATEEQNKAAVLRLYSEGFDKDKTDVVKDLVGTGFVQHDSSVPGGADGQVKYFQDIKSKVPGAVATVKHAAADGDLVAVHWQASATPDNEKTGEAVVDLYRLAGGKVVEHWDVVQQVPATTASGNTLFNDVYQYPNGAPTLTEDQEEANKQFAAKAYGSMLTDPTVLDNDFDSRYYQHNPQVGNGSAALKAMLKQMPAGAGGGSPRKFDFQLADGGLVWLSDSTFRGVDIFRVVDNKIIEHWDVSGAQ